MSVMTKERFFDMSKSTFKFALLGVFAALTSVVSAVTAEDVTTPKVWNKTGGGTFNYRYHEPQTKESGKTYPLVIFCHGAGERGTNNSQQLYYCANEIVNWFDVNGQEMYFVAGQVPKDKRWVEVDWTEKWRDQPVDPSETMTGLIELVEHLFATEQIDRSRVYITGISMGGFGTWDLMCRKGSDWFAAGMPVCGGGDTNKVSRITDIPIRTFHGDADPIVPVENSRTMVAALKAAGGDITYTEIPGAGHDVWTSTYGNMENLNWLFTQKNPKYAKAGVTTWSSKYGTFARRIAFTAGGYTGSSCLYDFPVLVRLSTSVSGFSYSNCAEGKFVFTDAYGNRIPHEVDTWNASGTSLVWVRLPELQKNTTFYMYFDGEPSAANTSSATWTAYSGVWHMKEASATGVADSADGEFGAMSVSGKTTNGAQESVTGVFGSARTTATATSGKSFLSVAQNSDASTKLGPSFSVSGWVKCASEPTSLVPFMSRKPGLNWQSGWEVALAGSSQIWVGGQLDKPSQGTGLTATASGLAAGAWTHIAVVYSTAYNNTESSATVYVNGSTNGVSCTGSIQIPKNAGTSGFSFGGREYDDFSLVGSFDELRYRNGTVGADWVKAEYDQSGTAFLSNGGVETSGGQQEDPPQDDPPQDDPHQEDPPQEDPADALLPSGGDDTAAIQSAISGAATGDVITLGSGVFSVSDELTIGNAVVLKGQGWTKTVIRQTGAGKRVATLDGGAKVQGVTLTGGSISGNGYNGVKGAGVLVKNGTISWCCISNNTATAYNCNGGGVSFDGGQGRIDHSIVANNTVTHATQTGVYGAGIGFTSASGEVVIDTCLVYGNAAATQGENVGGGIFASSEFAIHILNTTVTGNVAGNKAGGIGFGSVKSGSFVMKNCIVAGNSVGGSENNVGFQYSYQKTNVQNGSSYCLFGLADEVMGTASASGEPGFVDAATGDYRLSAAKELGCSTAESLLDLDGCGRTGALDVGCYEFGGTKPEPQPEPIVLGTPTARPSTNYNGSAVKVSVTGDFPDGAAVSARVTIAGGDYAGTVTDGVVSFAIPDTVVTAGNVYAGTITLTVGNEDYTKAVTLTQGTLKLDEKTDWIAESAATFEATGTWDGDRAESVGTKIAVSNAVFTAETPSPVEANVSVTTVMNFRGATERPFDPAMKASVQVVKVADVNRYAFLTGDGAVTNLTAVANVSDDSTVKFDLDYTAGTVTYTINGTVFGPFAAPSAGAKSVSCVRYDGATEVASLAGSYRFEGIDANLAEVDGVEYATVEEAIAEAGPDAVRLLWDASWEPSAAGEYAVATNGHVLAIGGPLAWSVKDNGDGTLTVTVAGGPSAPEAASITVVGKTVTVAVRDARPDLWYALEKTTDLSQPFVVATEWAKGAESFSTTVGEGETTAFYRVVARDGIDN